MSAWLVSLVVVFILKDAMFLCRMLKTDTLREVCFSYASRERNNCEGALKTNKLNLNW